MFSQLRALAFAPGFVQQLLGDTEQLSGELEQVLGELMTSPDYEAFESDEQRRKFVEQNILNIQRRTMNAVRRDARFLDQDKEKRVKERLDRMSGPPKGVQHFQL